MKKFYLAYGSNLNVKQMQFRCPDAKIVGTAEIPNYQLLFKGSKTGFYLTIEPKQGCTVPVAVWSVSERDELALDRYEGYPHFYYKTELELPLTETGKKLTAFVYIMHEERKLGIPTSAYIRTCVDGYRQFGFDLKHLRKAMDISEREVYHHEEELKQQNVFRFWDRFLILCEHYHISADYIVREYSSDLTKEYLLRLKYSKEEPDTAPLENIMQLKYGVSKEFWNTAPEHIMEHLTAERKENE